MGSCASTLMIARETTSRWRLSHHEEKQGARRRVDVSVCPSSKAIQASLYESIYDPYLVIEGKRLPAPSSDREREYLTGFDEQSGGVQRFRLCLHGRAMSVAVMVGYVQRGEVSEWLDWINNWIDDLARSGEDNTCSWSKRDHLGKLKNNGQTNASRCESRHARVGGQQIIRLIHLWIVIAKRKKPGKRN